MTSRYSTSVWQYVLYNRKPQPDCSLHTTPSHLPAYRLSPAPLWPPQVQYNDRSPMENYHAAATWMKLREEPHNFLKKLPAKVGSQAVAVKKLLAKVLSQRGIEGHGMLL